MFIISCMTMRTSEGLRERIGDSRDLREKVGPIYTPRTLAELFKNSYEWEPVLLEGVVRGAVVIDEKQARLVMPGPIHDCANRKEIDECLFKPNIFFGYLQEKELFARFYASGFSFELLSMLKASSESNHPVTVTGRYRGVRGGGGLKEGGGLIHVDKVDFMNEGLVAFIYGLPDMKYNL